jgi:2-methylcitrate dehydratase PrpD
MAVGFIDGNAGLAQFTEERVRDSKVHTLASKVRYVIDPENEYPHNFTGHLRATMHNGTVHEILQPHRRGGCRDPLSQAKLITKFRANAAFGRWDTEQITQLQNFCENIHREPSLFRMKQFRR